MPRIPSEYLNCAVYLYSSTNAARQGRNSGGCGFLLGIEGDAREPLDPLWEENHWYRRREGPVFLYVVTCRHVAEKYPVARVNRQGRGGSEGIRLEDWTYHEVSDLAVAPVDLEPPAFELTSVGYEMILPIPDRRTSPGWNLDGLGDEVFIVSRFIKHDGKQTNRPAVRFGNISVLPREDDPIFIGDGIGEQVAYLTEVRTVPGASGSPVFLHIPGWELREAPKGSRAREQYELTQQSRVMSNPLTEEERCQRSPLDSEIPTPPVIKLLGVAGGFLFGPDEQVVYSKRSRTKMSDLRISRNAGMEWCIPSWKLLELLRRPELRELREVKRREWKDMSPP